ncbi:MAG: glycosyltransferase [Ferruginibacter sp.]
MPEQVAGTEIYTLSLAKELLNRDIKSIVLIPNFGRSINEEYEFEGIRVIKYAEPSVNDREFQMGKKVPVGIENFLSILRTENPSVVNFHSLSFGTGISLFHLIAAKEAGYKTVTTFHLPGYTCWTSHLMYKDETHCNGIIKIGKCTKCVYSVKGIPAVAMVANKLNYDTTNWQTSIGTALGFPFIIRKLKKGIFDIAANSDRVVVLAKWYKNVLELNGIEMGKVSLIAQGLPGMIPQIDPVDNTSGILKIVFIGRISPLKGLHLLIDALILLPQNIISLDIFGSAGDQEYFESCLQKSAILKNLFWKGSVKPAEVVTYISQYDILCLPSLSEMAPIVIQEAFAAGVPVLASDIYANKEQVTHNGNGWLFSFNNSTDLTLKLQMLIDEPEKIVTARKNIPGVKLFTKVAEEYEVLYEKIIKENVPSLIGPGNLTINN